MKKSYIAEMLGTMVLVLLGCGSASFGNSELAVAFAFGLSVVAMAYCIGNISGCHINPAITIGAWLSGRIDGKDAKMYILFQFIGGILGAGILALLIKSGKDAPDELILGANGYSAIGEGQAFLAEVIFTFLFVLVVLGATDSKKGAGNLAGLAIGLTLVLIHIVCIPLTGTSVNPARSFGPAVFQAGDAFKEVWLFILAPCIGGALSAFTWKYLTSEK